MKADNPTEAVYYALTSVFSSMNITNLTAWTKISREFLAALHDTNYDIVESDYCEHCPVRHQLEEKVAQR